MQSTVPAQYAIFPIINASLNGASTILLLVGRWFISQRRIAAHRVTMITAVSTSTLFLISYLYYHAHVGSVRFQGTGWSRPVYFTILISHVVLAAAIVPLVIITLDSSPARALRPPPRHCPLDVSAVAVRFGNGRARVLHALSLVCGVMPGSASGSACAHRPFFASFAASLCGLCG